MILREVPDVASEQVIGIRQRKIGADINFSTIEAKPDLPNTA